MQIVSQKMPVADKWVLRLGTACGFKRGRWKCM